MVTFVRSLLLLALPLCQIVILPRLASAFAPPVVSAAAADSGTDLCSAEQQRQILPTMMECEPRPTIVRLSLPNATYIHMAPQHVSVNRCGGSCHSRYHNCISAASSPRSVEVMLIQHSTNAGATPSECAIAEVEEDVACSCGCAITQDECSPAQIFVQQECRCVCADESSRADCLNAAKYWNPISCSCMCRDPVTFPTCPTGYYFDSDTSCTCVPLGENASTLLEILVLVLVSSCLLLGYGSLQLLRRSSRNVGLDQRKNTLGVQSLSELRTLFSQASSRNPSGNSTNDSVNGDSSATVSSSSTYGLMRPRAKTFSFFPLRGYEELPEDSTK